MPGKMAFEPQFVPVVWTEMQAGGNKILSTYKANEQPRFCHELSKGKEKKKILKSSMHLDD